MFSPLFQRFLEEGRGLLGEYRFISPPEMVCPFNTLMLPGRGEILTEFNETIDWREIVPASGDQDLELYAAFQEFKVEHRERGRNSSQSLDSSILTANG